jgi:hypothetical protein
LRIDSDCEPCRSDLHFRLGHLPRARADALAGLELAQATGQLIVLGPGHFAQAQVDAVQGAVRDCREHLDAIHALPVRGDLNDSARLYGQHVAGLLELTCGRPQAAVRALERCRALSAEQAVLHPGVVPWRSDLAEALARAGEPERARAEAHELAAIAERYECPLPAAAAARVQGLLAGDDDVDERFARRATSARSPDDELTPQELQVALTLAAGQRSARPLRACS